MQSFSQNDGCLKEFHVVKQVRRIKTVATDIADKKYF